MENDFSPYVLGLDFGTQSVRVGLFDSLLNCVAMGSASYPIYYPKPGWAEQKPEEWWSSLKAAIEQCLNRRDVENLNIEAMAVCATSSTVLAVDNHGNPQGSAILWMDTRAREEAAEITAQTHDCLKYCGGQVSAEWMVPKLLWMKRNVGGYHQKDFRVVEMLDWVNFKLTGEWVASQCNVTCKANYVSSNGGWDDSYFNGVGLPEYRDKIPTGIVGVGGIVGHLSLEASKYLGLPRHITVIQGGIDAHIAMVGTGAIRPGHMALIMGTSFVHLSHTSSEVHGDGLWGPYPEPVLPGNWLLEGGQTSGASLTQWFQTQFLLDIPAADQFSMLETMGNRVPPGSEGLLVFDGWQGNRTPYRDPFASGAMFGFTLKHTRDHIYRAILEGVGYGTRNVLETFAKYEQPIERMVLCGGASRNNVWNQIIADICGVPLEVLEFPEAGLLGCAVVALHGIGYFPSIDAAFEASKQKTVTVHPDKVHWDTYTELFGLYKDFYLSTRNVSKSLKGVHVLE